MAPSTTGRKTARASRPTHWTSLVKLISTTAPDALLKNLFQTAAGADADTAARLVDAIGDWKDADDLKQPRGAEAPEYQAAGLAYKPANASFENGSRIAARARHELRVVCSCGRQPDSVQPAARRQSGICIADGLAGIAERHAGGGRYVHRASGTMRWPSGCRCQHSRSQPARRRSTRGGFVPR
mgnify:CR=1 FL=1